MNEAATLENLAALADAQALDVPIDGGAGQPTPPEETGPTAAQIIAGAVAAGREVFCVVTKLESPRVHLGDQQAAQLGALWAPVLEKHGIDVAKYLGDYALEIAAIMGTGAIVLTLRRAVIAEISVSEKASKVEVGADAAANVG